MKNDIQIEGFIQFEPILKDAKGSKMCTIKINNKVDTYNYFFTVICFDKLAENVIAYFQKGDFVYVDGQISSRLCEGKQFIQIYIRYPKLLNKW